MKGLIAIVFCFLTLSVQASVGIKARDLTGIKLSSGEIIGNLSLQESTKVLKSLDQEQNIEIRTRVIYPEEILNPCTVNSSSSSLAVLIFLCGISTFFPMG
jgi:hypothetical protein